MEPARAFRQLQEWNTGLVHDMKTDALQVETVVKMVEEIRTIEDEATKKRGQKKKKLEVLFKEHKESA